MTHRSFIDPSVKRAFERFPLRERQGLMQLRKLIFDTAQSNPAVGDLEEALRWGQPAYLTPATKSGSTLRLGVPKTGGYAIYAHCQTSIIANFQDLFPDEFTFEGNRALHFKAGEEPALDKLGLLVSHALTYHL